MAGEKKLSTVPFEDFLVFLFKSATTTPTTSQLSSSKQPKEHHDGWRTGKDSAIYSLFNDQSQADELSHTTTISRRYSCPEILATDSEVCSSFGSSLSIREEDNNDSQIQPDEDDDDLASRYPTPAQLFSRDTSLDDDGTDNNNLSEPESNSCEPLNLTQLHPKWRSSRCSYNSPDLSFYKNFSASTRSKSSYLSNHMMMSPMKSSHSEERSSSSSKSYSCIYQQGLSRRFTRSVPTKLNKMSRLRSIKSYYEEEYSEGKTRPPLSFDKVEKSRIIDPTLSDESATMSLFLDAVHLNQQVDSTTPSFGILYQY